MRTATPTYAGLGSATASASNFAIASRCAKKTMSTRVVVRACRGIEVSGRCPSDFFLKSVWLEAVKRASASLFRGAYRRLTRRSSRGILERASLACAIQARQKCEQSRTRRRSPPSSSTCAREAWAISCLWSSRDLWRLRSTAYQTPSRPSRPTLPKVWSPNTSPSSRSAASCLMDDFEAVSRN